MWQGRGRWEQFTQIVALLVRPVVLYNPEWTIMDLQGHQDDVSKSRP